MNILGTSTVSLAAAQAWARKRGAHDRYVLVSSHYWQFAPRYGIPAETAYVQAGHETGWGHYPGVVPPEFHNWCGLKTEDGGDNNDPEAHQRFPDDATGVLAHIQHLARYAGLQALPAGDVLVDPRWHLVTKFTDTVEGLGGAWAPSPTYGQRLVTLANDLIASDTESEPPMPTVTKPPMNTTRPSPNRDGYNTPRQVEALVYHIATATIASNLSWLTNPNSGASCNYYIAKSGTIYELVPPDHSAWTNGQVAKPDMSNPLIARWVAAGINPNTRTVSIEHEGEPSDTLTAAQIKSNNHLTAWVAQEYGLAIDRVHVLGHYQIDGLNRQNCPSFSPAEWGALIEGAKGLLVPIPPPSPPDDSETFDVAGIGVFVVGGGFYQAWKRDGGIARHGLPLTDEMQKDGRTVQWFERSRLEHHPGVAPENWDVLYGRVGAEALEARTA